MSGPGRRCGRGRQGGEAGLTLIEVLVACLVLVVGLLGLFGTLNVSAHTTRLDRERQAETSLAREVVEDARTLAYTQLNPATLAGGLQPMLTGASVSGQGLVVQRRIFKTSTSFTVALGVCSVDDPADAYGSHASPPASGGAWCDSGQPSGIDDARPDDYKRLSVAVTPGAGSEPTVRLSALIYGHTSSAPSVSCLSLSPSGCTTPSAPITDPTQTSATFYVTTTGPAAKIQWLVNGDPPPSAQIAAGAQDPYDPSGTPSFSWVFPTINGTSIDGTYTISAYAQDAGGTAGSRFSVQVTVNRNPPPAPAGTAIYNGHIGAVDIQWPQSSDQDILYYDVYHQVGTGPAQPISSCSQVIGTSCTDPTATPPAPPSGPCPTSPTDISGQPNVYWVIGYDTDPNTGQPRASAATPQTADANICDNPPSPPSNLTAASQTNGTLVLNWTAPAASGDIDPGDKIQGWRIYRWTPGSSQARLSYVDASSGSQPVATFTDRSPDPGGATQDYCVTSVDTHLNESTSCSNTATG